MGTAIIGWGAALPEQVVTNVDLEKTLDTSDTWIFERTGIRERRIGGVTSVLAIEAGRAALERAGVAPDTIDLVLVATSTPDQQLPATASTVQTALGITAGAVDLNAACSGFVYGLVAANGFLAGGMGRVLLIGAEAMSTITDWDDRDTAVLFGDGAGALVLDATPGVGQLLGWDLGSDGSTRHILFAERGGTLKMDGKEVFRRAVRVVVESATIALDRAGIAAEEVSLFIPHQANVRIIDAAAQRLGIPSDRCAMILDRTGNTSAASIPMALVDAIDHDRVHAGDVVLMVGFGAGMSWASAVVRWEDR